MVLFLYCYLARHPNNETNMISSISLIFLPYFAVDDWLVCYHFWPTILSVVSLVHCVICRLSSVCDVLYCGKTYVLAKKCLKEWIGNQGQKVDFLGRCHISTLVSPLRPPRWLFLPYFGCTAQRSVLDGTNGLFSSKPCVYCRIVRSELKPEVVLATIVVPERCK